MVEPVLKWAGGKRTLIPRILDMFPADYKKRTYHEPFIGGGAVLFKIRPESGSINDINPRLMNFYKVVQEKPEELILRARQYTYDEEAFYKLRDRFNHVSLSEVEQAALLLYLNKTAYNGLYRVNSRGEFNVPFGSYKNPTIVAESRIRMVSRVLQRVEILNKDFSYVMDYAQRGDICYLDPPYQPLNETADFTSYSAEGFGSMEQERLRDLCVDLDESGVLFVLSNSYTEPIVKLYEETGRFVITVVQARRAINSKASRRGAIDEVLVSNIRGNKLRLR